MNRTFNLPDLGEGLADAEIVTWHVQVGDRVEEDQALADVETAKAIVVVPSPYAGTLMQRPANEGDTVAVGDLFVVIDDGAQDGAPAAAAPVAAVAAPSPTAAPRRRPLAAPTVRRIARERGIDLSTVAGSGPAGRIAIGDLDRSGAPSSTSPVSEEAAPQRRRPTVTGDDAAPVRTKMRGLRRATSRAMRTSWQEIPHIFDLRTVDATRFTEFHAQLTDDLRRRAGRPEVKSGLVLLGLQAKITMSALHEHPEMHGYVDTATEEIVQFSSCRMAVAMSTPDGLVTPVLHDLEHQTLPEVVDELTALVGAARERTLRPDQLNGATFCVNNLGALGTWFGTPLIPPGLGGNAGFGRINTQPVVRDGQLAIGDVLPLSISADHRLVDGAVLAAFAATVARLVETPTLLIGGLR